MHNTVTTYDKEIKLTILMSVFKNDTVKYESNEDCGEFLNSLDIL